jgi:membrane-associated protease RseP (regulator of RpoE activity)
MQIRIAAVLLTCLLAGAAQANLPPPEGEFTPGFTVIEKDGRPVVETVVADSAAAKAGIEPGFHVLAIAEQDAMMWPSFAIERALHGYEDTVVQVIVSDQTGNVAVHHLVRTVPY